MSAKRDPRLAALLERIIDGEGGVMAADGAGGQTTGTFSRWTTKPHQAPAAKSLRTLADHLGQRYGFTAEDVLEWAGYLPPKSAPTETEELDPVIPADTRIGLSQARGMLTPDEYAELIRTINWAVRTSLAARRREGGGSDR